MRREKHWTETVIVDTVVCDWCEAAIERTTVQVRAGKRFCDRVHASKWVAKHAPRTPAAIRAKRQQGQRLGRQRGRVIRDQGAEIAADALIADLQHNQEMFFLRTEEWARLRKALMRAYSRGHVNAYRAAWQRFNRQPENAA